MLMQHVVLTKANKAVAWARHLFEFPGKFPEFYSDAIYDGKMTSKKNIKQSPEDI